MELLRPGCFVALVVDAFPFEVITLVLDAMSVITVEPVASLPWMRSTVYGSRPCSW